MEKFHDSEVNFLTNGFRELSEKLYKKVCGKKS